MSLAVSMPHTQNDDEFVKDYEAKQRVVEIMASLANVLYKLNWFMGACSLTWATTIILGGIVTNLSRRDYFSVVVLLLLDSVRLSAARLFSFFVLEKFVYGSADPMLIVYDDKVHHWLLFMMRILEQMVQLLSLVFSIIIPIRRRRDSNSSASNATTDPNGANFDHVHTSLTIFYTLVLVNAILATIAAILSKMLFPLWIPSTSLRKYFDKIVWIGMDQGFVKSSSRLDFPTFAFEIQADEYRHYNRAAVLKDVYEDMIRYLLCHPKCKGFEKARELLDAGDPYEKEAAANIVGCWGKWHEESKAFKTLMVQKTLLSKLADALDNDEIGRAAASSLVVLAEKDPMRTARIKNDKEEKLVDIIINRIHDVVEMGKPNKALVYIKLWIHLLLPKVLNPSTVEGASPSPSSSSLDMLGKDLVAIVKDNRSVKRTQAVAAYALHISGDPQTKLTEELKACLEREPPKKEYIFWEERNYLFSVLNPQEDIHTQPDNTWQFPNAWSNNLNYREIHPPRTPCVLKQTIKALAHSASILLILVTSIFIYKCVHLNF